MSRDQLKRLKELETENQRLKRVVADLSLDKMILTEAARDEGRKANTHWMVCSPERASPSKPLPLPFVH